MLDPNTHDGLVVTTFHADGSVASVDYGPTSAEELTAHQAGKCHCFCGYCMEEAEKFLNLEPK